MSAKEKLLTGNDATVPAYPSPALARSSKRVLYGIAGASAFAALTFAGANIYIPLKPVPITMQTLFVLLSGAAVGARYGLLSQFLYVGLGAVGLPLFAEHLGGWAVIAGPTGGYLLAFLVTPLFVAAFLRRRSSILWQTAVFSAGTLLIFAAGVVHLTIFYTRDLAASISVGVLPFLPGAVFKVAAAVSIYRSASALYKHRRA